MGVPKQSPKKRRDIFVALKKYPQKHQASTPEYHSVPIILIGMKFPFRFRSEELVSLFSMD
jgi:hypothetical protein